MGTQPTMSLDITLVDTNVLVYAMFPESEHYNPSRAILDKSRQEEINLCITPQIFSEFYAIVTNTRRVTVPCTSQEALRVLDEILELPGMILLPIPVDILDRMKTLLQKYPVTGHSVFDIQLLATILGNGIEKIYTFDRNHFERFSEIQILQF
jgi:predicted nucleic acid-binding protein